MLTEEQRAGLQEKCQAVFDKKSEGLVFKTVKTKFNLHATVPASIPVFVANGVAVEPGDPRPMLRSDDVDGIVAAATHCGLAKADAIRRGYEKWPGQPLVWAENWGLHIQTATRKKDSAEFCFVDVRGYVLPERMLPEEKELPTTKP